jgi:iron(III) transport system substrate-binding protein
MRNPATSRAVVTERCRPGPVVTIPDDGKDLTVRKTGPLGLGALLAVGLITAASGPALAATKNRANGPCTTVGAKATISGKAYVCTTVLGKKVWQLPPAATAAPATVPATAAAAKSDSWDQIVEKAKKEGSVTIYSSQNPTFLREMGEKFKAKYGITLEVFRDVDANIIAKVEAEKGSGKGIADVLAQASAPWQATRDADGFFVPPVGPNFSAPTFNRSANLSKSGNYFTSTAAILTYGWNTQLYRKGITDYPDFLDPSLSGGKIGVIDPAGGAAIVDFYLYLEEKYGASFIAKLGAQRPRLYVSSLPMAQALTSGEIWAGVFVAPLINEKAAGAPVDWGLSDTVWGARFNTAVLKQAPHPNAAQVLADYLLTQEAQQILARNAGSLLPGIGVTTVDKVRIQNVAKLSPEQVTAFQERWRIIFT